MNSIYRLGITVMILLLILLASTPAKSAVWDESTMSVAGTMTISQYQCFESDTYFVALKSKLVVPVVASTCTNNTMYLSYPDYVTPEMKQEIKEVLSPIIGEVYFE